MSSTSCSPAAVASVGGLVLFGTTTSLLAKIVYELQGPSLRDGKPELFRKPWAMTTVMFVGMSFCLPLAHFQEWQAKNKAAEAKRLQQQQASSTNSIRSPLLDSVEDTVAYDGQGNASSLSWKESLAAAAKAELRRAALLSVPTAFDLVATVLMNVGLLSVTASVYQMMRGAEMLFAALFAVLFLRRRLNRWHLGGIGCCVAGIGLVGAASVLSGEGSQTQAVSTKDMVLGMALIIASQAVQAAQLAFEDHFMSDAGLGIAPLMIVGYEGLIGAFLMLGLLLPVVSTLPGKDGDGIHEDTADTWHMITHSPAIAITLAVDMTALLMYNVAGMAVTGHLGAVFRTVLETGRTLFVWVVDLLLFYGNVAGEAKLGESWSSWSWMQLGGFAMLVAGTLVYGRGDEAEAVAVAEEAAASPEGAAAPAAAAVGGGEQVLAAPSSSSEQDQLLPPAPAPGPLASQQHQHTVPVTMSRRTSTSTPISVIGTPMSFKSTMNINHFSSSYVAAGSLSGSLQPGSWGRGLVSSPPSSSRPQPRGSNGV